MGQALVRAIVCGLAGAAAWVVAEPGFAASLARGEWSRHELVMLLLLGGAVGLAAGLLSGLQRGGRHHVTVSALLGLALGAFGGMLGHGPAGALFEGLGGSSSGNPVQNLVPRTVAFLPLGGLLGLAVGASSRAWRPMVAGAVGGLLAAVASGATFDLVSASLSSAQILAATPGASVETGAPGRALLCAGLGMGIGLFTAIVDRASRRAWIRLVLGRNEGREWALDSSQTLLGRDERAHIPLFDDPSVPPLAAVIERKGRQFVLVDPGSPIGVGHNGIRVPSAVLSPGDTIQIGSLTLVFMARGAAAGRPAPTAVPGSVPTVYPGAPGPAPSAAPPSNPTVAYPAAPVPSPAPSPGGWRLVVASGPMAGAYFPVDRAVEIGREGAGFAIPLDQQASRKHCVASPDPGGVAVADLGSTNGTLVNGQRVQSAVVRPGDTLQVGATLFRVEPS